jgi:hypothetical protein
MEPADWMVEVNDSNPITEGSATLYGYVTGNFNDVPGTEIYYDNLRITPNKAAGKGAVIEGKTPAKTAAKGPIEGKAPATTKTQPTLAPMETYYYPEPPRRFHLPLLWRLRR